MRHMWEGQEEGQWTRFGFLFADLFTALAMLFLLANTAGQSGQGGGTGNSNGQCGLAQQPSAPIIITLPNADALRKRDKGEQSAFVALFRSAASSDSGQVAGLVQLYGGSYHGPADVQDGLTLAKGAIEALSAPAADSATGPRLLQKYTLFQSFWDGDLTGGQVKIVMFFYQSACAKDLANP